jgi:hypothetical protein
MVTLQADPTLAGFNAYCTRAEANSFLLEERLFALTAWEAVENKDAAIIWATRELDRLAFLGYRTANSQAHEWPRSGIADVGSDEIPDQLKWATAELAFYLAQSDRSQPTSQETFESIKAGPIELKFRESVTGRELTSEMPDSVTGLLKRFMKGGSMGSSNRMAVRV